MCDIGNLGSANILEKTGLTFIETFDFDGIEHKWYKITKDEWMTKTKKSGNINKDKKPNS